MTPDYKIATGFGSTELVIKKSVFKSFLFPVLNQGEAQQHLDSLRQQWPDATHHCYAFCFGPPGTGSFQYQSNDDGEPSGTAGKPILNVILKNHISDLLIVVVRYFGGVKLGAGGLTRAYTRAAADVLKETELGVRREMAELQVKIPYEEHDSLRRFLSSRKEWHFEEVFQEAVYLTIVLPKAEKPVLVQCLESYPSGSIVF